MIRAFARLGSLVRFFRSCDVVHDRQLGSVPPLAAS